MDIQGFKPSRRSFLKSAAGAGALVVFAGTAGTPSKAGQFTGDIGPFVRINADNSVVIGAHVPDMGQGTFTSLPMIVAEELDVAFETVTVEQMPLLLRKNDKGATRSFVGAGQSTAGGSNSVRVGYMPLRQAGARARQLLVEAAADRWGVPASELTTDGGVVIHTGSGRKAPYGALAADAAKRPLPTGDVALKSPNDFKVIGKPQRHRAADRIVKGEPLFGIDACMPGMLHAVIARSPYIGGGIESLDDSSARGVSGVRAIIPVEPPAPNPKAQPFQPALGPLASGVAVIADSLWAAMKGRDALKVTWKPGSGAAANEDSAATFAAMFDRMAAAEGTVVRNDGDVAAGLGAGGKLVEARYESPIAAHICMEPLNALVSVAPDGSSASAILATQAPDFAVSAIAAATGIDPMNIHVEIARMGGGFGRKYQQDMVGEAALLSKAVGKPVKLVWTREDDIRGDMFRPGACHLMQAAIDGSGKITAWRHKLATHSMLGKSPGAPPQLTEYYRDDFPGAHVENFRVEYFLLESAMQRGAWRAPGHVANAFAIDSFLDELAHAAGKDPLQMRLDMIGAGRKIEYFYFPGFPPSVFDTSRLANVLRIAAEKADWGTPLPQGRGRGIAARFTFESYVAEVFEVTVDEGNVRIDRVVAAVDCGRAINPNGVRMQVEGSINDGISAALGQAITIKNGQVEQINLDTYQMARLGQSARRIEVYIVESDAPPNGMGEPAIPPAAPALANAIFAATGKRIRKLPIADQLA